MLVKLAGRIILNCFPSISGFEADPCPGHIAARISKDSQNFRIIMKFHTGLSEDLIRIRFDLLKPFFAQHIKRIQFSQNKRRPDLSLLTTGRLTTASVTALAFHLQSVSAKVFVIKANLIV